MPMSPIRRLRAAIPVLLALLIPPVADAAPKACTVWYADGGGTWSTAANWRDAQHSAAVHAAPGATDVVCFNPGDTVSVDATATIDSFGATTGALAIVTNGALNVTGDATLGAVQSLAITGGALMPDGTLPVAGDVTFSGGSVNNGPTAGLHVALRQAAGHQMTISGSSTNMSASVILTDSPISLATGSLQIGGNGVLLETTSSLSVDADLSANGQRGTIKAARLIVPTAGDLGQLGWVIAGTGSTLPAGTTSFFSLTVNPGAALSVAAGGTLRIGLGPGVVGSSTVSGTLTGAGTVLIPQGGLTVTAGGSVAVDHLTLSGTGLLSNGGASTTRSLTLNGGGFTSTAATLTVDGDIAFNGGDLTGDGLVHPIIDQTAGHALTVAPTVAAASIFNTLVRTASPVTFQNPNLGNTSSRIETSSTVTFPADFHLTAFAPNNFGFHAAGARTTGGGASLANLDLGMWSLDLTGGTTTVPDAITLAASGVRVEAGATLEGTGTVAADLVNAGGTVSPGGAVVGTLTAASYNQVAPGVLAIDVASKTSADRVVTTGPTPPSVGGTIHARHVGGFRPAIGDGHVVVDGTGAAGGATLSGTATDDLGGAGHYTAAAVGKTITLTFAPGLPGPPVLAGDAGNGAIDLRIGRPAADGGSPIDHYTLHCTPDCGSPVVPIGASEPTPFHLAGLNNNVAYTITATAHNGVGDGPPSNPVTITPTAIPIGPPGPPRLEGDPANAAADLRIFEPGTDGGAPIDHYTLHCVPDCGSPQVPFGSDDPTLFHLAGLTNGTTYTITATAHNEAGDGPPSNPVTITPTVAKVARGTISARPSPIVIRNGRKPTFTATCRITVGAIKACAVVARTADGAVVATATGKGRTAGRTLAVVLTINARGKKLAATPGGIVATVTGTITPVKGPKLRPSTRITVLRTPTTLKLLADVLFDFGSAAIRPEGARQLARVARQIAGSKKLECDGHTDDVGTAEFNQQLGMERATAVCNLLKRRVKATVSRSFGETRPVAPNDTEAGRQLNRRVELVISN
jgi:outer membrane protein OmpA-like peptidoglycan-associated protein